jgi:hypothetical protein
VQQQLGNSHKEYDKSIVQFSIRNQVKLEVLDIYYKAFINIVSTYAAKL